MCYCSLFCVLCTPCMFGWKVSESYWITFACLHFFNTKCKMRLISSIKGPNRQQLWALHSRIWHLACFFFFISTWDVSIMRLSFLVNVSICRCASILRKMGLPKSHLIMRVKNETFEVVHRKQLIFRVWLFWTLVMQIFHDKFTSKDCPTQNTVGWMMDR